MNQARPSIAGCSAATPSVTGTELPVADASAVSSALLATVLIVSVSVVFVAAEEVSEAAVVAVAFAVTAEEVVSSLIPQASSTSKVKSRFLAMQPSWWRSIDPTRNFLATLTQRHLVNTY